MTAAPVERIADHLIAWLRRRADEAGAVGAVVAISGGVDSAAVAALCMRAFPQTTLGLLLPCHSDPRDAADAERVCRMLGVPHTTVVLDGAHDALVAALRVSGQFIEHPVALANLKPRLRMTALYYFANRMNRLVVGTGNRSELTIGYFTKYGDGGVDLLPIGKLLKSEVRAMARELDVPERVITKAPSAGLWLGQTDEQEMGFTYADLEHYLMDGPDAVSPALAMRIERLMRTSDHKRTVAPTPDV